MAIQNLTTETMLELTERWLAPAGGRRVLEAHPATRALVARLEAVRQQLRSAIDAMDAAAGAAAVARALAELAARASGADALHDRKARGVHGLLTALIDLADEPAEAQSLTALRGQLFPHGLAITSWQYDDEAANGREVRARLDGPTRAALEAIHVERVGQRFSLAEQVDAWLAAAAELGQISAERGPGLGGMASGASSAHQAATRARGAWTSAVFALIAELTVDGGASTAEVEHVLGALRDAEEAADSRMGKRANSLPSSSSG